MNERLSGMVARLREVLRQRTPWLVLLVLVAICYYGSYYRHGLNFKDEGGTEVLLAKRLLEGERPLVDVVLGYNVLWYYPIVGLYKLFGVSFVLLRVYCFALSTVTAVLGFITIERAGRRPWLAFLVSLMLVLVPGMTHKNYMPLLAVGNACCLLHFALASRPEEEKARATMWRWVAIGGLALGLTWLIRIDVGIFCSILWVGAMAVAAVQWRLAKRGAVWLALGAPAALIALVLAVHAPFYLDAHRRGFAGAFLAQYSTWPKSLMLKAGALFGSKPAPAALPRKKAAAPTEGAMAATLATKPAPVKAGSETLRRKTWRDVLQGKPEERLLTVLLYGPLASYLVLISWAVVSLARAFSGPDSRRFARSLGALLLLGASLSTFPQYFFFRPDAPHLSEFSPGFWTAVAGTCLLLGSWRSWPVRLLVLFLVAHAGVYLWRMLPDRWTGTIWVRKARTYRFQAENGVDVMVSRREVDGLRKLQRLIRENSRPGEYLVAYPYHPTVNVLADRPTYEKNVYIDNATSRPGWDVQAIKRLEHFKPAIVVLSDWDVNGTNESRFSVWAEKTKTWVQTNYTYQGTYLDMEVYTRGLKSE